MSSGPGGSLSLNQKRVLVTDIETDFGREIANALITEGALVLTLVKECRAMQQVLDTYPQLTPVLLDINKEKCEEQARKLLLSLPTLDHFVNLSGDFALNIISQCYTNAKIHEVSDVKAKPIVAKMGEGGGRSYIFHVSTFGNQNIMSKLKANLDPRFSNSKTAQMSTNLRQSLKKMFSGGSTNGETSTSTTTTASHQSSQSTTTTTTTASTRTQEVIVKETHAATNFAAMAATLNQNHGQNGSHGSSNGDNGATNTSTSTVKSTPTASGSRSRIQGLQEKNTKIRQTILKLQRTCAKKWKKNEKRFGKEQQSALKALTKEIERSKKIEKANLIKQISDANASTQERSAALSADTANRIQEAREKRAEKEVEKHAQKKLETETPKILEKKDTQLAEYHEKLYKKMVQREIDEFNRIKSKYLV